MLNGFLKLLRKPSKNKYKNPCKNQLISITYESMKAKGLIVNGLLKKRDYEET